MRDTASTLSYDSPAYQAHEGIIEDLTARADQLGFLRGRFRTDILGPNGIVCNRSRGDEGNSVSRSYFSLSVSLERGTVSRSIGTRDLVMDVLAARLSLGEKPADDPSWIADGAPDPAYSAYAEMVRDFVNFCEQKNIPSLLPNLFEPASLTTRLRDPAFDPRQPEIAEMYQRLIALLIFQDKHLHAATTALQRNGGSEQAVVAIQTAASDRGLALHELFESNPIQADTYVDALFSTGRHTDVVELCQALSDLPARPKLVELYLRSLIQCGSDAEAAAFLDANAGHLPTGLPEVRKAIGVACEQVGWTLYGAGEYARAKSFLETHATAEIHPRTGRMNMQSLYTAICEAI